MKSEKISEHILQLNKQVIFKYRNEKLPFFKRLAYKFFGWYADSIGEALWESNQKLTVILDELTACVTELEQQNESLSQRVQALSQKEEQEAAMSEALSALENRVSDIEKREQWVRERFEGQDRRFESGEQFQDWARERFDGQDKRFESGEQFQDWARERFDGQDRRFESGEQFQDWARERFDGQDRRFESGEQFQDWARERFDGQDRRFESGEQFQDWARERFDGQDRRFESGEQFQDWARERFDGQDRRFESGEQFQDWARERCDGLERRISDIEGREEWTRNRFEELDKKISPVSTEYDRNSFSQAGEDIIADYVLRFLKQDITNVRYLDLGANHAKELSNSYYFYQKGAHGVLIEANPELIPELRTVRPNDVIINKAISFSDQKECDFYVLSGDGLSCISLECAEEACKTNPEISIKAKYTIPTVSVNDIISEYFPDGKIDILSIDLEGVEDQVLKSIDLKQVRPKVIILESIEYKPYLVCQKRSEQDVNNILAANGYKEYAFTGINSIYLDMQFVDSVNAAIKKDLGVGD